MITAYAWNTILVDSTDIGRSISAVGIPLKFLIDIALDELPEPIDDAGQTTIQYICSIAHDTRFFKDIVLWIIEERRE